MIDCARKKGATKPFAQDGIQVVKSDYDLDSRSEKVKALETWPIPRHDK